VVALSNILSFILLVPVILWSTFQPMLFINATMVEQTLRLALYEGQKEASLQGRYDQAIYDKIRDYLVEIHHYEPEEIEIKGTETITPRGERMYIEITVPKPVMSVGDIFRIDDSEPFTIRKYIMSEYIP